jgi:hypothetical protein
MRLDGDRIIRVVLILLLGASAGCIDFDRVGQGPPHGVSGYSSTGDAIPFTPTALPHRSIDPTELSEYGSYQHTLDTGFLGTIAVSWLFSGILSFGFLCWFSYRRYRSKPSHGIGSALRPMLSAHREILPTFCGMVRPSSTSDVITSRALVTSRLPN